MHRSNSSEYPSALLRNDAVASGTTTISAQQVGSTYVSVTYKTLSGNQPQAFGNVISVWNGTNIGWDNRPSAIVTVPITQDTPDGDMVISLGSEPSGGPPYMVAYGTSKSGTTYCAAQIGGVEQPSRAKDDLTRLVNAQAGRIDKGSGNVAAERTHCATDGLLSGGASGGGPGGAKGVLR